MYVNDPRGQRESSQGVTGTASTCLAIDSTNLWMFPHLVVWRLPPNSSVPNPQQVFSCVLVNPKARTYDSSCSYSVSLTSECFIAGERRSPRTSLYWSAVTPQNHVDIKSHHNTTESPYVLFLHQVIQVSPLKFFTLLYFLEERQERDFDLKIHIRHTFGRLHGITINKERRFQAMKMKM